MINSAILYYTLLWSVLFLFCLSGRERLLLLLCFKYRKEFKRVLRKKPIFKCFSDLGIFLNWSVKYFSLRLQTGLAFLDSTSFFFSFRKKSTVKIVDYPSWWSVILINHDYFQTFGWDYFVFTARSSKIINHVIMPWIIIMLLGVLWAAAGVFRASPGCV